MTTAEKLSFKNDLKRFAIAHLESRIRFAQEALDRAQEAANEEGKSSMGDKYEVGRAMGQLDSEMYGHQLEENNRDLLHVHQADVDVIYNVASNGSVVMTDAQVFFIAVGLGIQKVGDKSVAFISLNSPLGHAFAGKKSKDEVSFNGKTYRVMEIF